MFYICTNFKRLVRYRPTLTSLLAVVLIAVFGTLRAQRHELGIRLGMSNLVGDIGRTNYILQKPFGGRLYDYGVPFYAGVLYRMNFNPYQTLRFDLGWSHVQFDDKYAKEQYRRNRGYWGTNSAFEADVLFEYYFLPVNNEQKNGLLSPYIFGGLGFMTPSVRTLNVKVRSDVNALEGYNELYSHVDPESSDPNNPDNFYVGIFTASKNKLVMSTPFGVGLKYKFNYNWALSGEFMFRPTFSDGIDYSAIAEKDVKYSFTSIDNTNEANKKYGKDPYKTQAKDDAQAYLDRNNVGNTRSKDWINSITLSLTYSFGRPPCYCEE